MSDIERVNARYGEPPTVIWTAAGFDDCCVVVAVGLRAAITKIAKRFYLDLGVELPCADIDALNESGALPLSLLVVSVREDFDAARSLAAAIHTTDDFAILVENLRKVRDQDPTVFVGSDFRLPVDLVEEFAQLYLHECVRSVSH